MTIDVHRTTSGRVTAARLVATLGVLGATAAIAGLGTFGTFSDTTSPVDTSVDSGVVSIDVADAGSGMVPFTGGLMLPGDSRRFRVDLVNSGNTALGSVSLASTATASSVLDTDAVNGLQLRVENCSQPWTESGSGLTCVGTKKNHYAGRMVVPNLTLSNAASLASGGVDHLLLTASLPSSASSASLQGASSSLRYVFTGVQRGGASR